MERLKGKPFALIGVNSDALDRETLKKKLTEKEITWRNALEGEAKTVSRKLGINGWPTVLVLDATGKVRYVDARGGDLDRAVEALLMEKK